MTEADDASDGSDRPALMPFEALRSPPGTRNIMLTLAYDGTAYSGWQVQPARPSVQLCVENAIEKLTGERRRVYCAGRTDAGVHALGQVANFFTLSPIPVKNLRAALQTALPEDVTLISVAEVSMGFHATFSAIRKRYRYVIHDAGICPPFLKRYCAPCRFRLQTDRMHEAAQYLLGRHDFRCFEKEFPNKETSVRHIMEATVCRTSGWGLWDSSHQWSGTSSGAVRKDASAADIGLAAAESAARGFSSPWSSDGNPADTMQPFVVFEVMADGFLYNMVRAIVGTLIDIGRGKRPVDYLKYVIESMDRSAAGMTAVPQGLYMVQVEYPDHLMRPDTKGVADSGDGESMSDETRPDGGDQ
ncbi:MAG: tRNA pseudouridine(38-40) synthase TruA [Planctomycetia bacterium]